MNLRLAVIHLSIYTNGNNQCQVIVICQILFCCVHSSTNPERTFVGEDQRGIMEVSQVSHGTHSHCFGHGISRDVTLKQQERMKIF